MQNEAYCGFENLAIMNAIIVRTIPIYLFYMSSLELSVYPQGQPTNIQELRDSQPSKLSQKTGFMALRGEA